MTPVGTAVEFEDTPIQERSPISSPISGQLPSPSKSNSTHENTWALKLPDSDKNKVGRDSAMDRVCLSVDEQQPEGWILRERLDSKEAMMMDGKPYFLSTSRKSSIDVTVPILNESNLHPPSSSCPSLPFSTHCLLPPEKPKEGSVFPYPKTGQFEVACLKKVTDIQSLNIELSWRCV